MIRHALNEGEVRFPALMVGTTSWKILHQSGNQWKSVLGVQLLRAPLLSLSRQRVHGSLQQTTHGPKIRPNHGKDEGPGRSQN